MGILIFVILSIDILLYNVSEKSYNKYCEIINIVFLIIITILILRKINNTVKLLYKKLYYAQTLIPDFIDALLFKLRIFHKAKVTVIIYPIANLLLLLIHIFIPDIYVSVFLKFIDYYFLNLIFLDYMKLLIIKNIDFAKDLENDPGKIFKLKISLNSDGEIIHNDLKQKDITKIKKKKLPIIIFGPSTIHNKSNYLEMNRNIFLINSVDDEKDINRFYTNLQIGFYE